MISRWRNGWLLFVGLLPPTLVRSADPPPEFVASGIARGDRAVEVLVPGAGMSIYGRHLGPARSGCVGSADLQNRETPNPRAPDPRYIDTTVYPRELCGTQVFIGDQTAGLLYVSESQINLKVPQDSPESGTAEIRVVYQGQSSGPVTMKAGFERISVSLDGPAYTDMPVWLKLEFPFPWTGQIQYPFILGPAGFGCNEVEVRRNGQLLPLVPGANWYRHGMALSGNICGSYGAASKRPDRLPVHLVYRFDVPGTYEVRFTLRDSPFGAPGQGDIRGRSEWTSIEVLPSKSNQRAQWLDELRKRAPADPSELLSDVLPGVLGLPDQPSLEFVLGYLYHPDAAVRRYAMNGLYYWPDDLVSLRLRALLQAKGPNDDLARFLRQAAIQNPAPR
jgi:hypothetical protein